MVTDAPLVALRLSDGLSRDPRQRHQEMIMYCAHNYEEMTEDKRPQDEHMDGRDWKFETLEHGGEYPDMMPQAIRATDAQGRSCIYLPVTVNGKVVDSKGFVVDSRSGTSVVFQN